MITITEQPTTHTHIFKQKVTRLIIILVCISASSLFSQNPFFSWATSIGGSQMEESYAIAKDAIGNVYTTGHYEGTVDFDPSPGTLTLTSVGQTDVFILKQDANGNVVWARSVGSNNPDYGTDITIDPSGNVLATGAFSGQGDFDPSAATFTLSPLTINGNEEIFVLKLDANGNFIWARSLGGSSADFAYSIATNSLGDVYTTGYFKGTADFDPSLMNFNLASAGGADIFVSKLSSGGNFVWAKRLGGSNNELALSIASNASGLALTGYFEGTVDFDPATTTLNLISNGNADIFVCVLDHAGTLSWALSIGDVSFDAGNSVAHDNAGNILVTGNFRGTADFDPSAATNTLQANGSSTGSDVFIAKYSSTGTFIWAKNIGNSGNDYSYGIAIDQTNNIYTTGSFDGTVDFDPGTTTFTLTSTPPYSDVFIHKLDAAGNFVWAKAFGNSDYETPKDITIDGSGNIYTTGFYENTIDFNPDAGALNLTSNGQSDFYVHKLSPCSVPLNPINNTPLANQTLCNGQSTTLSASGSGTLSWYASATATIALTTGIAYNTPTLSTGTYTYYVGAETCTLSAGRTLITVSVSACTGTSENNKSGQLDIVIYPNPSKGNFEILFDDNAQLTLTNSIGQLILTKLINAGVTKIDLADVPNGVYFLSIHNQERNRHVKIIKE